jgi:methylenetetrahydrofolate reductase (NADPH)
VRVLKARVDGAEPIVSTFTRPTGVAARVAAADEQGPSVSFELYPPKTDTTRAALPGTIAHLAAAHPDFFSVTYGASGSTREVSRDVVRWILENTSSAVVAHLTCIGLPWEDVRVVAEQFVDDGVRNLLALRGDPPAGAPDWQPHPGGLTRASDLVARLHELGEEKGVQLSVGVAATPSARWAAPPQPPAPDDDIQALLAKERAGADYAITQVFFEPDSYIAYRDAARAAGVRIPLLPGIVPLTEPKRLRRLEEISGVPVPPVVLARLDATDGDDRRAVGNAMGVELVRAVLDAGAPGVHLYTFNQHTAVLDLLDGLGIRPGDPSTAPDPSIAVDPATAGRHASAVDPATPHATHVSS